MADVREQILVRLLEVCGEIEGIAYAARHDLNLAENNLPAIIVIDADEEVDSATLARNLPNMTPMPVHMNPHINLIVQEKTADVGTVLNEFRAKLIKTIPNDSALQALAGTGGADSSGGIRYQGATPAVSEGRMLQGQMILRFRFSYVLKPNEL